MAFEGMNTDEVDRIGGQLMTQADQIGQVMGAIDGLINQAESNWQGKDAQEFKQWWMTQHKPALAKAQEAVHGLGQSAKNNASQQRTASNS